MVAVEASSSAHHWGRRLVAMGLDARIIAARLVAPYRLQGKSGHSTVTDLARLRGLCLRPALRALTSLREVSLDASHAIARACGADAYAPQVRDGHSTVTDLARLRGLSTSVPRAQAVW